MKIRAGILFLFLFLTAASGVNAQQPVYTSFTVENGLPSNEVYDIFEDSLGYIWFATDHGIAQYDGYNFRSYSTADGLVHNTIFGFFEDVHHRVWMRTFNSALCYMENGKFYPYKYNQQLQDFLGRNFIQSFVIDASGDLWFMSIRQPFGLYHQFHTDGHIVRVPVEPGYNAMLLELGNGISIAAVDFENYDRNAIAETSMLHRGNGWYFNIGGNDADLGRSLVRNAWNSPGNFAFSFNEHAVIVRDGKIERRFQFSHLDAVNNLYIDRSGTHWICIHGAMPYRPGLANGETPVYYNQFAVHAVKEDRRGNFWFATGNGGVLFVPGLDVLYQQKLEAISGELLLAEKCNNHLFVVARNGHMYHLGLEKNAPDSAFTDLGDDASKGIINTLLADEKNNILHFGLRAESPEEILRSGTFAKLSPMKPKRGGLRSIAVSDNRILQGNNTSWMLYDKTDTLLYDSKSEGFQRFCTAVAIDASGQYWIGTTDGLYVFTNGKTTPYHPQDSIFRQRVTDIVTDSTGGVIVSTRGAGLIIIRGSKFTNLREKDGMSTDLCGKILLDDSIIWVCSNKGLNRIAAHGQTYSIRRITVFHGLSSNMINDIVGWKNLILLATGKGLCWFDKTRTGSSYYKPAVYINDVQANQQAIQEGMHLKYNENNLAFSFIGLLFNAGGHVEYRYRLEGYDTTWNYTSERTIRYFNIPDGDYKFMVSAKNENGIWNEKPATFSFHIPKHFSQTWWFRMLFVLSCIIVVWLVIRIYIKQRRLRERMTSDMLLAELNTLRSQMKPHFIFNSLNSIQHFILERDEESAHLYLTHFSSLMRKILDNTRQNTIPLSTEIETLRLYLELEKLRFGENFRYTISVDPEIETERIGIPPMLIQPYAENAIWHGLLLQKDNPELKISFALNAQELLCVIEDNGIGREQSRAMRKQPKHNSAGMKNIEERVAILNRVAGTAITINVEDLYHAGGTAAGTRVVIRLPLNINSETETN
jgi:ligand-binding sensor domain-containing protein